MITLLLTMPYTNDTSRETALAPMVGSKLPYQHHSIPRSGTSEVSDPLQPDVNSRPDVYALREPESASSGSERLTRKFEPGMLTCLVHERWNGSMREALGCSPESCRTESIWLNRRDTSHESPIVRHAFQHASPVPGTQSQRICT